MDGVAKCIIADCGGKLVSRGLCSKCATAARKAVKEGSVTWPWLEQHGLATPVRRRRTSVDSPFLTQLQSTVQKVCNHVDPDPQVDGAHAAADGPTAPESSPVASSVAPVAPVVPTAPDPPCPALANSQERQAARERQVARTATPVLDVPDDTPSNVADLAAEHAHREQYADELADDAPPALPWEQ